MAMTTAPVALGRRRRGRWAVGLVVALLALGAAGTVGLTRLAAHASDTTTPPVPQVTLAKVIRTTLSQEQTATGTLGYGAESSVAGSRPGTITALPGAGSVISRGQSVYQVDALPIPLFYGTLPFYRRLATKVSDGPDVLQLEQNLKALGFDDFGTPDETFDWQTRVAIQDWQKSLGLKATGAFSPGDVVLAPGRYASLRSPPNSAHPAPARSSRPPAPSG